MHNKGKENGKESSPTLASIIGHLAGVISSSNFPTGDRAKFKRMTADGLTPLGFYRFAYRHLPKGWEPKETQWRTICAGIALMCPNPHHPDSPVGKVLAKASFSESRLERLLDTDGKAQMTLTLRVARFLSAKNMAMNWTHLATLLLSTDIDKRQSIRKRIAGDYYRNI